MVPCSGDAVKLLSTVASRYHPEWSFASIRENKQNRLCRVGDEVNNRTVSGITCRFLFLRGSADECYLDMFDDGKTPKDKAKPKKAVAKADKSSGSIDDDIKNGIKKISDTEREVDRAIVDRLLADPTKARETLGWSAQTSFEELIRIMVESDLELQERASGRRRGRGASR